MFDSLAAGAVYFSPSQIVSNIVVTFVLAVIIALVYKNTHKGMSYSQSFVFTLVIMSILVAIVMMVIGNSLARAFGLLGAFSIIRFRTPVKDTKDTTYIFFALAIGMAVGTENYSIAIIGTVLISAVVWLLDKFNFGSMRTYDYILSFTVLHAEGGDFEQLFKKYFKNTILLNMQTRQGGSSSSMTYQATFLDEKKRREFVEAFSKMGGVGEIQLIAATENIEY